MSTWYIAGSAVEIGSVRMSSEDWTQGKGPRGGTFWQNTRTGERRYQTENPGGESKQKPTAEAAGAGASKAKAPSSMASVVMKDGVRMLSDGSPLPEHIQKIAGKIPPAWTEVSVATDPNAALLVSGKDAKGRRQSVYSANHTMLAAKKKFDRITALIAKKNAMKSKIASDIGSNNTKVSETASVARLIMSTGIRPGSDRDTGAEKQAYGATTLRVEHVVVNDSKEPGAPKVILTFTGKKGVDLKIPVHDEEIAKDLIRRAKSSKDGRLFGTTDGELRDYVSKASGGKFKPKDFRTLRGTELAADVVREHKCCDSEKERKAAIKHVAKIVSTALGNTPAIALQSYIDPIVFAKWSCENCGASSSTMSVHFNSMDPYNTGADVYWHGDGGGDVESEDDDVDVDDEELEETPSHIVSILGFDPKTEFSKQPRQPKVTNVQK